MRVGFVGKDRNCLLENDSPALAVLLFRKQFFADRIQHFSNVDCICFRLSELDVKRQ
jgi:hypothetical protein